MCGFRANFHTKSIVWSITWVTMSGCHTNFHTKSIVWSISWVTTSGFRANFHTISIVLLIWDVENGITTIYINVLTYYCIPPPMVEIGQHLLVYINFYLGFCQFYVNWILHKSQPEKFDIQLCHINSLLIIMWPLLSLLLWELKVNYEVC